MKNIGTKEFNVFAKAVIIGLLILAMFVIILAMVMTIVIVIIVDWIEKITNEEDNDEIQQV